MDAYLRFVLRHRLGVLLVCGLITALAVVSLSRAVLASSVARLFLGENPRFETYLERSERFGGDQVLAVGVDDPAYLTPEGQARLRAAARGAAAVPGVDHVESVLDAGRLEPGPGGLPRFVSYAAEAAAAPARVAEVRQALARDPLARGLVVARDGGATAVLVTLTPDPTRTAEAIPGLVDGVVAAFEAAGYRRAQLHLAGMPALLAAVLTETRYTLAVMFPLVAVVLLVTVWLLFHRLWPAVLSLGVALVGVVWTMGFSTVLDREVNILLAIVPAVVCIVAFSDVVHLCSAYLLELEAGRSPREAALAAGVDVGRACVFTSLTTFVGFVSLSLIPTPAFRLLGLVLGFGVAAALLLATTVVPVLFTLMPRPRPLREGATGRAQAAIDRLLTLLLRLSQRHPRLVVGAFGLLTLGALAGATRLEIDTELGRRFAPDHPVRMDRRWFAERFAGAGFLDLYVDAPAGGLGDPVWLARAAAFQDALEDLPTVDAALSYVDVVRAVHGGLEGRAPGAGELPADAAGLTRVVALLSLSGGAGGRLERLVDVEAGRMRFLLRLAPGAGFRATAEAGAAARRLATEHLAGAEAIEVTGLGYLLGDWLDEIVEGQRRGLSVSALTIAALMVLGLRSLRIGLWSMLPNLLPLLVLAGWLGATWDVVDSDVLALCLLALGIGVDDTIHFLTRYRIEQARGSEAAAVERTVSFAGRAIVMTTLILVAGFVPFATSDYLTMQVFGTLLPQCLIVALLADVLLVPALIRLGWMRYG